MSEHRRKPPQPNGGGRAAPRRGAQPSPPPSPGRRDTPPRGGSDAYGTRGPSAAGPRGEDAAEQSYGSRAEARRAAQSGGRRRTAAAGGGGAGGRGGGRRGTGGPGGERPKRFIDYPRWGKSGWRRWMPSFKQISAICVVFLGTLVGLVAVAYAMVSVPSASLASKTQKNVYYWADGSRMVVSGGGDLNRQIVPLDQISKSMQNAVISMENASFYTDHGVDPQGILRAVVNMARGGETQSGSTITQQYVKNTYLDQSQTVTRKLKELMISIKVGVKVSKPDILAGYLNTAYYGRGAYGIQAASQAYYGVNANALKPEQAAFLAAVLNGPNLYDPAGGVGDNATPELNTQRAKARWGEVLDREVKTGDMNQQQRQQYQDFPTPQKPKRSTDKAGQIGYLTDLADKYIFNNTSITQQKLAQGGYQIYTTFNKKDMTALQNAVDDVRKKNIRPDLRPDTDKYVQFGGASVVPGDGAIAAIYGGEDYLKHFTDNADYTGAQVGSTFKPFVLAAAMRDGVRKPSGPADQPASMRTPVSPKSKYTGVNKWKVLNYDGSVWQDKDGNEWLQQNDDNESFKSIDLKSAMEQSVNSTYVQLGMDVGLDKVKQSALDAGVTSDSLASTNGPSFSIGTSSPSAIRMADAYATFAKSGLQAEPYSVTKVMDSKGVQFQHEAKTKKAFDPAVADNVTDVLQGVIQDGTGTAAKALGRPAAGKTGTTDDNKSAWFTGYTPQLSTSIGMYRMDDQSKNPTFLKMYGVGGLQKIYGASFPTEIWTEYMKTALADQPAQTFEHPQDIGTVVYGDGASPSPSAVPSTTPSNTPSTKPSTSPSPSHAPSVSPSPSDSCGPLAWGCQPGGTTSGGGPGGGTGGPSSSTGPGTGGTSRGNGNGGLFGGPGG
ncbi:transglycosylase domain-containing protein [Streptantibioticus ferralitis]|uniref:Transglycosylase domain-containing protein n=1 Tax=Streptantibioticus ferralitis TaxID=236510 RepID=A0ABT5Z5Q9_9ACTN|nr:transglycosylase domain-containing protein [Streptantibioticus ferralitis]MDF2258992.1 transglycosylase domain-containing protein [Streptantibioticus ferralitis]